MNFSNAAIITTLLFSSHVLAQNASSAAGGRVYQGFNSGAQMTNSEAKTEDDFTKEFQTMQKLAFSPGLFNTARLYTNVQANTISDPLSAFPAAIKTNTSMLLGIWASGSDNITNELDGLSKALDQYGADFANLVIGISVGSEDLFRFGSLGQERGAGIGAGPEAIVGFINDTRRAIEGTLLADKPIGHVDTWRAWANESNSAVVDAVDWLGTDIYPFFENDTTLNGGLPNTFANAVPIFQHFYNRTLNISQGKPVWVTETGWPYENTGPGWGEAEASQANMAAYWHNLGCADLFGRVNTFWYTLKDADLSAKQKFAITSEDLSTTPSFNLTCPAGSGAPASINTEETASSGVGTTMKSGLMVLISALAFALLLQ